MHRDAVEMGLPEAQGGVERVLDLLNAAGFVVQFCFEDLKPKLVVCHEEMSQVLIHHLQQDNGADMPFQECEDDLPWKVL